MRNFIQIFFTIGNELRVVEVVQNCDPQSLFERCRREGSVVGTWPNGVSITIPWHTIKHVQWWAC